MIIDTTEVLTSFTVSTEHIDRVLGTHTQKFNTTLIGADAMLWGAYLAKLISKLDQAPSVVVTNTEDGGIIDLNSDDHYAQLYSTNMYEPSQCWTLIMDHRLAVTVEADRANWPTP